MYRLKRFSILTLLAFAFLIQESAFAQNTLTKKEKKEGWVMLFDGSTFANWKGYNQDSVPSEWSVSNGALQFDPSEKAAHKAEDLVTREDYQDFDLSLEWKISKNGNSGILYNVVEDPKFGAPYNTGPEMQVLDNEGHHDGKILKHRAGDLYDLIKSSSEPVKPVGEWNHVEIISKNAHYQFFLNGVKIVEYDMHTPEWDAMVAASKFKRMDQFGKATKGKICLQAHGNQVFFRAVKIRKLS